VDERGDLGADLLLFPAKTSGRLLTRASIVCET